jgi:hypothetical protein
MRLGNLPSCTALNRREHQPPDRILRLHRPPQARADGLHYWQWAVTDRRGRIVVFGIDYLSRSGALAKARVAIVDLNRSAMSGRNAS